MAQSPIMVSAKATGPIFPGAAVAQSGATVSLASPSLLASHIANLGAQKGGVVSMISNGEVYLTDWTLSTGSKYLMANSTYFVGGGGRLVTTGGQPVGIATTKQVLTVTIQSQAGISTSASSTSQIASMMLQIQQLQSAISMLNITIAPLLLNGGISAANYHGVRPTITPPTAAAATIDTSNGRIWWWYLGQWN